jgi:hypothetical protein
MSRQLGFRLAVRKRADQGGLWNAGTSRWLRTLVPGDMTKYPAPHSNPRPTSLSSRKLQTPDAELKSRRYSEIFTKPKKIEADNYSYQIPPAVELLPSHPHPGPLPRIATRKTSRHWFLDAQTLGFQPEPGRGEVFSELPIAPLNRP